MIVVSVQLLDTVLTV